MTVSKRRRLLWLLGVSAALNLIGAATHLVNVTDGEHTGLFVAALTLQVVAAVVLALFFITWLRGRRRERTSTEKPL